MRSLGKKITCLILALAMVFALTPVLTGPAYADADMVYLPAGEVMASSLEAGHNYYADSAGTTIILEADDDVTVDFIGPRSTSSTLTIKGSNSGKLRITDGIDMQGSDNALTVEAGTIIVDRTASDNWKCAIAASHYTQHGGNVTAKIHNDTGINVGLMANGGFLMDGGLLNVSAVSDDSLAFALYCEGHGDPQGRFVMNGGTITASAKGDDGYILRFQHLDMNSGELIGTAEGSSDAQGFAYCTYLGSTFDMNGGTIDLTLNAADRATAVNIESVDIHEGDFTVNAVSSSAGAYGINNQGENASFKMEGGSLDINAKAASGSEAYPLYLQGVIITGGKIKATSRDGHWGYGMWIRYNTEGAKISGATLDLSVENVGTAYGIASDGAITIDNSKVTMDLSSTEYGADGIYNDKKVTLNQSTVNIKVNSVKDPSGMYIYDGLEIKNSIVDIEAKSPSYGAGVYVEKEFDIQDSRLSIDVSCGDQAAQGIHTGEGEFDWNVDNSTVEVNVANSGPGSYGNGGIKINLDEDKSNATITDSTIKVSCSAPDSHAEGFTSIPSLTLSGASSIEAVGEGGANAHGIFVRGMTTINGNQALLYGKGTVAEGYGYGIWGNGGFTMSDEYKVTIPEGGVLEDGLIKVGPGEMQAPEGKIEGLPAVRHTVTFDPRNGESTWTESVVSGKPATKLGADPIRDGWDFDSWGKGSITASEDYFSSSDQAITEDTTLYARYKTTLQVSAEGEGSVAAKPASESVKDSDYAASAAATIDEKTEGAVGSKDYKLYMKPGEDSTFNGWYVYDPATGEYVFFSEEEVIEISFTGNASYKAVFESVPKAGSHLRIQGDDRYSTAFKTADYMKQLKGIERFGTVIVADGRNFADALSGSYLAAVTEAPILLVHPIFEGIVLDYIADNVKTGGKVYLLGGTGAVSEEFEVQLKNASFDVERLGGENRFDTNVLILNAANKIDGTNMKEVLVCSGINFADALSTSSVGKPILLVGGNISDKQKQYLTDVNADKAWIVGGTAAVNESVEGELTTFVPKENTRRLNGDNRYETSYMVANEFFNVKTDTAVLVFGQNFPDGLSGGAVASVIGSPVLLAMNNDDMNAFVAKWVAEAGALSSITLGGPDLVSDESIRSIMNQPEAVIILFEETE